MTKTDDVQANHAHSDGDEHSTAHRLVARGVAYGAIVRGIVHEVRNPLQSIIFAAQSLTERADTESDSLAEVLVRSTDRLSHTLEHLAHLFDGDPGAEGPVVVPDIVRHVIELQSFNRGAALITLESQLTPQLPAVTGRVRDIEDALCILINVSIDAVGEGKDGRVTIQVAKDDDATVAVRVCDTARNDGAEPSPSREDLASGIVAAGAILGSWGGSVQSRTDGNPRTVLRLPCWSDG